MKTTTEEIKVYIPDEGKAIKLTLNGKLVMYMVVPYYALPNYNYEVEEVNIDEAKRWVGKTNNKVRKGLKFIK